MMLRRFIALFITLGAGAPAAVGQAIDITVEQFGVGSAFRPGWIVPIRFKLVSKLTEPTPVWVQWEVPNADGDIQECGRSLTLTPNVPAFTWLYAPLPPDTNPTTVWNVRVFEERDGERKKEIAGTRISPTSDGGNMVELERGMIAVVGRNHMGLADFNVPGPNGNAPLAAHEDTRIIYGISPAQLPDRWEGLRPFEALVWGGDRDPPTDLNLDQANAIRDYVRNGGHLIISLPAAGNPWGLGVPGQNQLEDLLPHKAPRKDEAVPITALVPVLSKSDRTRGSIEVSIRVFKDLKGTFNAIDNHYEPIIALPDDRVIAVQRTFGHGRITIIGIDLSDGRMLGLNLPQGDAFWNRILGRRADTPSFEEQKKIEELGRLGRRDMRDLNFGSGPLFTGRISMTGEAAIGLLLALVLFAAYWLLAGPVGFAVLKHYKKVHLSWLAFAGCAAVFTVLAWGSVSLVPKGLKVQHVTILDHIARPADDLRSEEPQFQKAVSFFSVYLPSYQATPIEIASSPGMRDLLFSWTPPGEARSPFPNVDRYKVDVGRSPASFSMPARSTTTQMYAHWQGGLDPKWGGMLSVDPNNPIRVVKDQDGNELSLTGSIINNLPATLTNTTIIWVKSIRMGRRTYDMLEDPATKIKVQQPFVKQLYSGEMLAIGYAWRLDANIPWAPQSEVDLTTNLRSLTSLSVNIKKLYIDPYAQDEAMGSGLPNSKMGESDLRNYMEMLSLFQQLDPPKYLRAGQNSQPESGITAHRDLGRELDLSTWFTRPCLIIMGYLEETACPIPLRLDGDDQPPPSTGTTMIRWIYPLPLNEKIAFDESSVTPIEGKQ